MNEVVVELDTVKTPIISLDKEQMVFTVKEMSNRDHYGASILWTEASASRAPTYNS